MAAQGTNARGDERAVSSEKKGSATAKPLAVERLTHADIPEIVQLYKRVWDAFRPDLPVELVKAWEPNALEFSSWMEGVTYFAARRDGKMIGAIGCEISEGTCRIVHLVTDPEARRQGVATALTTAAVDWAKHNNVGSLWADALARFTQAAQMFKKLGFAECGVLHRHYFNEDVRLFEKLL
ncbi:MAG: GNAT family N-acetyltransferase [Thermoplasmata archaeon]|nr:GNAT family N-acetyltransferase [Thermoplasmata archaeon]